MCVEVHKVAKVVHDLATEKQQQQMTCASVYPRFQESLIMDKSSKLDSHIIGKAARKRKEDVPKCVLHKIEEAAWKQTSPYYETTGI